MFFFFFSSRRRHTRFSRDWSSDVCSSDLSALAKSVIVQLRDYGKTRRGWLGVRIQGVSDEIAESLGLDKARGALVASVSDKGPAQVAGVQPGDIVLKFDGKDVTDMKRLPRLVAETPIDKPVKVTVWRKRQEQV